MAVTAKLALRRRFLRGRRGRCLRPAGRGLRAGASVLRGESFSFLTETL